MIGLLEPMKKSMVPVQVQLNVPVVKVASGESRGICSGQELEKLVLGLASLGPNRQALHLGWECHVPISFTLRKRPLGDADS